MKNFFEKNLLPGSVFITGACVLIVEIVATRVLSPYYGNTIFTVSSVISVILAALSIGYYAGGKLADRHPSLSLFFGIVLISGASLLLFYLIGMVTLPILSHSLSITLGPLAFSLLLFFLPALLLGTLSPFAVKLQSSYFPNQGVGSVSGKIFFWSTVGSIAGSLLAGFVLIPNFGIDRILITNGIVLSTFGLGALLLLGTKKRYLFFSFIALTIITFAMLYAAARAQVNVLFSKDGTYEKITVYDDEFAGRPTRFFQQDLSRSGAMFLDSDDPKDLVYEYTKYYSIYKIFRPKIENTLVIGGGAYSIPKALLAESPDVLVDVAEIEESLFDLSKKYFEVVDNPRLKNYTEDGRRMLQDSDKKYDLVFSDVFYSLFSVPAQFTTQEFFSIVKENLTDNGVFMGNFIGDLSRQQPSFIMTEMKTFQTVFPNSYFFAVDSPGKTETQNIIFIGYNSDKKIDLKSAADNHVSDSIIHSLPAKVIDTDRFDLSPYPVLTDNYSPVEYLMAKVLQRTFEKQPILDGNEMLAIVDQQLRYGPRYLTASGHKNFQNFIVAEMQELAPVVTKQTWTHAARDGNAYELTNIIARINPAQPRRIVLGTHYDSHKRAFKDATSPDEPVPGANNSASGVAVLVGLAQALKNYRMTPAVGIDIVFFDGEEGEENIGADFSIWEPIGSTYFAEHITEVYPNSKPVSGLVLDMVCDKDLRIPKQRSLVRDAPEQVEQFWNIGQKVDSRAFPNEYGPDIRDDHTPLNEAGIPTILLIDYEYPHYATTADTLDKCSSESLRTVAEAVMNYVLALY